MSAGLTCPVCGAANEDLALRCVECKGFLQTKVDVLDLFATAWGIIETPRTTFKRIALARHKNYVFVLASLLGISLVYSLFWYRGLGEGGTLPTLGVGLLAGIPAGMCFTAFAALALTFGVRVAGGTSTFRNMHAVVAYASVPIALALIFVFPVELAAFGEDWFRKMPHPRVLKPLVYHVLIGLDACALLWALFLVVEGAAIAASTPRWKVLLLVFFLMLCGAVVLWGGGFL